MNYAKPFGRSLRKSRDKGMSRLEELIAELCPDGVAYHKFSELCEYVRGVTYNKSQEAKEGDAEHWKILRANNITIQHNVLNFEDVKLIKKDVKIKSSQFLKAKDILICAGSGSKEHVGKVAYIDRDMDYSFGGFMAVIRCSDKLISRYLYHILTGGAFKNYLSFALNSTTINNLNASVMANFSIPVPPLPVQREIVKILDSFTELTAELTAELIARQKQYEYYAGEQFPSVKEHDIEWIELGDVATVTKLAGFEFTKYVTYSDTGEIIALRGLNVKEGHLVLDDIKYIDKSNLSMLSRSKLRIDDMLFTYVGTVGQVALIDKNDKYYLAPNVALIRINEKTFLPKYVMYYFLTSKFKNEQVIKLLQASSMQNIPMEKIRKFKLPNVPLAEQRRVVSLLDRFDILCNDITNGLPAEIAARQKQYEYYRDKLLTFKEHNE